jgi:hypothetical protein
MADEKALVWVDVPSCDPTGVLNPATRLTVDAAHR